MEAFGQLDLALAVGDGLGHRALKLKAKCLPLLANNRQIVGRQGLQDALQALEEPFRAWPPFPGVQPVMDLPAEVSQLAPRAGKKSLRFGRP